MKIKVYICVEREARSPISRHHVAPYSICEEKKETTIEEISQVINHSIIEKLKEKGEVIVLDKDLISLIAGDVPEVSYIKLILV